ncbi:2'-5' RNA ligase family protein [Clostridium sp. YIM B02515]|uniref:2'-5' RNA ligase family protein n=1 Tax=Clostridium rhizosphaerae TaxID=2803861 RepID=A0ABS1TEH0_9CLOT|nr:2'-5' RNA ligase family protein [Clostridium rhizosphaerae]MBL4937690.1 2'-5' RNA ligase family protein [Clostridium rhizosphaerae]
MIKRCIMIFPHFESGHVIDEIREKYDPLANHVRPHITVVFPFESNITSEMLKEHIINVLSEFKPFELVISGITPSINFGRYLFLNVAKGSEEIIKIHRKLYTGVLEEYYPKWLIGNKFMPHMTVGNLEDEEAFKRAINDTKHFSDSFKTIVNKVSVEIIDENEDSIIENDISF